MLKTCIWIDATRAGDFEKFQFSSIKKAADGIADVYLVTNLSEENDLENHINIHNSEIFSKENNIKQVEKIIPGNPDLKLLALLKKPNISAYENFVRMEFDCVFSGDLRETIRQIVQIAEQYDVGFSSSFPKADHSSGWPWWKTFENWKDGNAIEPEKIYAAFLPVLTFNRKFIDSYIKYLSLGWRGHYEVMVPSVAHWDSLKTIDFGRSEDFFIDPDVFTVHRPKAFDSPNSKFFHPVKNFSDFRRLPTRILKNYGKYEDVHSSKYLKTYASERLTSKEFDLIKKSIVSADSTLIYGSPGLVDVACAYGIQNIDFISSDRSAVSDVVDNETLSEHIKFGNLNVRYINIGKTSSWGNPAFPEEPEKWVRYISSVPKKEYDTIILSGRFRVSLSANIYLRYVNSVRPSVIVTNFQDREYYHDMLKMYQVSDMVGRTAVLSFIEGASEAAEEILREFSLDYR